MAKVAKAKAKVATNYVRYVNWYGTAPKTAQYIFRRCTDGNAILQKYTGDFVEDLYTCMYNDLTEKDFREMLAEARKHMPENKVMYVEKPSFMDARTDAGDYDDDYCDYDDNYYDDDSDI